MAEKAKIPFGWHMPAHNAWLENDKLKAIQLTIAAINGIPGKQPVELILQLAYYFIGSNNHVASIALLSDALKLHKDNVHLLTNMAVSLANQRDHAKAYEYVQRILKIEPENLIANDIMALICSETGRFDEAKAAGRKSLSVKNALASQPEAAWKLPPGTPGGFAKGKMRVVSFSLWGSHVKYLRGSLRNMLLLPDMLPGWKARFYVDASVPPEFRKLLQELGAEIVIKQDEKRLLNKLAWRFLVSDDPSVGYFLVRDADSVFSVRESVAINEWLDSGKWFHVIRDWWCHTELILAGMWGGVAGALPPMSEMLEQHSKDYIGVEMKIEDQVFLRNRIWGYIRNSCLIHDRFLEELNTNTLPKIFLNSRHHIGQIEFNARREEQELFLRPWIEKYPCLQINEKK